MISVVIPTHDDWRMTRGSVLTVLASEVPAGMSLECIVLDNGSDAATAQMLDSLEARHDGVRVVHAPTNFGYAVGNNLAVGEVRGDTVVFLNNDTKVDPGWLRPLVAQLADPGVQAVQSLLLYPSGTIQSAGVVFPDCGGVPYAFLAGFPVEDAAGARARVVLRAHRRLAGDALPGRGRPARLRPAVPQRHGGRRPLPAAGPAPPGALRGRAGVPGAPTWSPARPAASTRS